MRIGKDNDSNMILGEITRFKASSHKQQGVFERAKEEGKILEMYTDLRMFDMPL